MDDGNFQARAGTDEVFAEVTLFPLSEVRYKSLHDRILAKDQFGRLLDLRSI